MNRVRQLGARGIYYLDAMGTPLELSYNPAHGPFRSRRAYAGGIQRIVREGRAAFGSVGTESGYLYSAIESDYIGSTFLEKPGHCDYTLNDRHVPLWFMAIKGHAYVILNDTYNSAIDFGHATQTLTARMLTMAQYGLLPRNEIIASAGGWGYPLAPALDAMKLEYQLMCTRLADLPSAQLVDHGIVSGDPTSDNHVAVSRFGSGTEIVCDYGANTLLINGEPYPMPTDYVRKPKVADGSICEAAEPRAAMAW